MIRFKGNCLSKLQGCRSMVYKGRRGHLHQLLGSVALLSLYDYVETETLVTQPCRVLAGTNNEGM